MSVKSLIKEQHQNGEETEFYPTTQEIVNCIAENLTKKASSTIYSILDIGCGNGNFFEKLDNTDFFNDTTKYGEEKYDYKLFKNYTKYGIEKSPILYNNCPDDVIMLGTDFYSNTLLDKKTDLIFCNPPYSDYEFWMEKIIKESNTKNIVMVVPSRWKNKESIISYIEKRKMKYDVWGNFDFENAERQARCKVDVVYIYTDNHKNTDPFDLWFEETFKINAEKEKTYSYDKINKRRESIKNELIENSNIAETLVRLYDEDMKKLYSNYKALENLDAELFEELHINIENLKESLNTRLQGLKSLYWNELFEHYSEITSRLTSFKRKEILTRLSDNIIIDFTTENIYQLTMWIIKNSNKIFDEQLKEFFYQICNTETIQRYKSNKRWNDDDWKYIKENMTEETWRGTKLNSDYIRSLKNIALDYRIVVGGYSNYEYNYWNKSYQNKFSQEGYDFINDLEIIAKNLDFNVTFIHNKNYGYSTNPDYWKNADIYYNKNNEQILFCNIKLYKNGNRHIKFCKEFIRKLNIEMARINKWINDKSEAAKEFDIPLDEINDYWNSNIQIGITETTKLLGLPETA